MKPDDISGEIPVGDEQDTVVESAVNAEEIRRQKRIADLVKACPHVFTERCDAREPFAMFGFEVGSGWLGLLSMLCLALEDICESEDLQIRVEQIKEKYAGLRFYHSVVLGPSWVDVRPPLWYRLRMWVAGLMPLRLWGLWEPLITALDLWPRGTKSMPSEDWEAVKSRHKVRYALRQWLWRTTERHWFWWARPARWWPGKRRVGLCEYQGERDGRRLYSDLQALETIENLVDAAESFSYHVCETCGKPGKLRGLGWLYTACDEHTEKGDLDENQSE